MAVKTLIFGILFLSLVYVVSPQNLRASFSNKNNGNANARFSGKPTRQVFSAKNSKRFTRPASFGTSRPQMGQGFHRTQATVTSAPFRRQFPSNGRNPFFGRRQQMVTDAPFTNRQQQPKNSWISPNNNQRSNNGPFRSNMKQQSHPLEQNSIQPHKNTRTNGFPTYRPELRQFAQPFQFQKEAITTQAPSVAGIQSFVPSGFNFGNANPSPSYKFEPSVQPQRPNQNSHPMADSLINMKPPLPPSQHIRRAQGGGIGGGGGGKRKSVEKNKPLIKVSVNNKIMNNPPPQLLANKIPLFQKPPKQNRNWRNNPNPRRQGGNRRINRQGKNSNWMKRKRGRQPGKPRQRPIHERTTQQPFHQQPFEPQAPFPGQPRFPFPGPALFNNQGQGPTPPTIPPTMPPTAPTNPPMFPPTAPSPYAPTFPPPTDPFYMPTSLNPTSRLTPSTPAPTRLPPPPKTTIDGIGLKCHHTAECSAGCCFDQSGTMLDTDTYGPNALKNGLASGTCQMKQPGLGETCDDLCACKTGFECYRRYKPNYKQGKVMAKNPLYEPPTPPSKPKRTCMRKAVTLAERWAFWKCYFDTACSGPLLK
ncbi:histone-lysine N-methyltransferase SETD1A-like [Pecten maximus]|uniref:histone-lysine N-methyltransferase SETD1A-like n=1 Tax=Pecten maximus TaxID=6579 RepID=UPI001458E5AF|nr:histone-lysine N-methyltransferase SETD1A-like [Pecten maximus]